ncbi:MAG TPA: prevent-host-death protein [Planctomycetota bacterium]|nr:prevent-host-death protein [Planctomycetota bacterium]
MPATKQIQFISNEKGKATGVIIPIALWRELESEKETAYLLRSPAMKKRLLEAMKRTSGISLEDARAKLGI